MIQIFRSYLFRVRFSRVFESRIVERTRVHSLRCLSTENVSSQSLEHGEPAQNIVHPHQQTSSNTVNITDGIGSGGFDDYNTADWMDDNEYRLARIQECVEDATTILSEVRELGLTSPSKLLTKNPNYFKHLSEEKLSDLKEFNFDQELRKLEKIYKDSLDVYKKLKVDESESLEESGDDTPKELSEEIKEASRIYDMKERPVEYFERVFGEAAVEKVAPSQKSQGQAHELTDALALFEREQANYELDLDVINDTKWDDVKVVGARDIDEVIGPLKYLAVKTFQRIQEMSVHVRGLGMDGLKRDRFALEDALSRAVEQRRIARHKWQMRSRVLDSKLATSTAVKEQISLGPIELEFKFQHPQSALLCSQISKMNDYNKLLINDKSLVQEFQAEVVNNLSAPEASPADIIVQEIEEVDGEITVKFSFESEDFEEIFTRDLIQKWTSPIGIRGGNLLSYASAFRIASSDTKRDATKFSWLRESFEPSLMPWLTDEQQLALGVDPKSLKNDDPVDGVEGDYFDDYWRAVALQKTDLELDPPMRCEFMMSVVIGWRLWHGVTYLHKHAHSVICRHKHLKKEIVRFPIQKSPHIFGRHKHHLGYTTRKILHTLVVPMSHQHKIEDIARRLLSDGIAAKLEWTKYI